MAAHRTDVDVSLHAALRAARPDVRPLLATKATLVATSHLVEDLVAGAEGRHVLFSGFQHGRHWTAERDRYLDLADASEVIAVFAGREPPPGWDVDHVGVRLRAGDPLTQEWFVLALGPEVAVTLCGLDADGPDEDEEEERGPDEGARLFEVIWSFDPDLARTAVGVVLDALAQVAPERAARAAEAVRALAPPPATATALAREADAMLAGMVDRVERLRRRERSLERRADDARVEFLARMGHELRSPLNAILGFTQLLQLEGTRPGEDREALEQIVTAGGQLLRLVDEALDLSRAEAGRLPLALETLDAQAALADALAVARQRGEGQAVRTESSPAAHGLPAVRADVERLGAVLQAVLGRALAVTPDGGEVRAEVVAGPRGTVRFVVRDRGPTLGAEDAERLFVPFARPAAGEAGTIGLPLAQRLARAMGGRLEVRGRAGGGSAMTLVLPAVAAAPSPPRPRTGRPQVLHVAGDPADLRLVERLLGHHAEVDVRGATRGGDGLALARETVPDLVLVDLDLPDLHGLEVLRGLRADPETAGVPVVVLTADATAGAERGLRDAGATEHLTKPVDVRRLLEVVRSLLGGG